MNKIKITKDMKFGLTDLMDYVDTEFEFTLRDVISACMDSDIPIDILGVLLQCPYIEDYYKEMNKDSKAGDSDSDSGSDILHLELSYGIEQDDSDPFVSQGWSFSGIGKEGEIPQDIINHYSEEEVQKMRDDGYTESFAVEFTPVFKLADYIIKIDNKVIITQWNKSECKDIKLKGQPYIRLIEVLYEIFWELSFLGSPEERDEKCERLGQSVDDYEQAKKDGTLKYVDFEEVKANFAKKYDLDI